MMAALLAVLALGQSGFVWSLYEEGASVTLAHEAPDTGALSTTMECRRGTGAARVSVYGVGSHAEFVTFRAGQASAVAEAGPTPGSPDARSATVRTDHPVFTAFSASGVMTVVAGAQSLTVVVPSGDLAKVRRFAQLCSG